MADMDWITDRIALGGSIDSLQDARNIASKGITSVLNLRTNQDEVPYVQKAGLKYYSNPTKDKDDKSKPDTWFSASVEVIYASLTAPGSKILVHCQEGRNRAPSTMYFFLRTLGLSKDTALKMITDARPKTKGEMAWNNDAEAALKSLGFKE